MYYLSNRYYDVLASKGVIHSFCNMQDDKKTQFVNKERGFGNMIISYINENNEQIEFVPSEVVDAFCEKLEIIAKRDVSYSFQASGERISVKTDYFISNKNLYHNIRIENISDSPLAFNNVGIELSCNSDFGWGKEASDQVIGHHFIGNHGSHSTFHRCDGKGPHLVMMPYDGTMISLIDNKMTDSLKEEKKLYQIIYVYPKDTCIKMLPGQALNFNFVYTWADDYDEIRSVFVEQNLFDIEVVPGFTVPRYHKILLSIRGKHDITMLPEYPDRTSSHEVSKNGDRRIYEFRFECLGRNRINISYQNDHNTFVEFFVTEPVRELIGKRGAFIAAKQHRDSNLWYDGLFAEWNNKTGLMLGPDCYDDIKGWRIYEVTCDDPGLSKPAFLSGKLREYPVQKEVDALEYYVEHFVWGGLQRTVEEEFPYGIYGIPDWHTNRASTEEGAKGRLHIWRIYDYPHIALLYYNLYRIAKDYQCITTKLSYQTYLERAYQTALAMFLYPYEIEGWSAYETGLYNECVIPDIIAALKEENALSQARRLTFHWERKIKSFILEHANIFGSEYPFDTTGFESTYYIAKAALTDADVLQKDDKWNPSLSYREASAFMEKQADCNIACRGFFEPAFYCYGSDYRGNNTHYLLSYMSQMGGSTLLDYALYYADEPFSVLRLAYGSLLSAWAMINSGDEESNYGYWFPGKQHDGAACGGFEPLDHGVTWLGQTHQGGAWYYSCETDLGFCGALRGNAIVLAEDPIFGTILYGGELTEEEAYYLKPDDGVGRRFHYIGAKSRIHLEINKGHFSDSDPITVSKDLSSICLHINETGLAPGNLEIKLLFEKLGNYELLTGEKVVMRIEENREVKCSILISGGVEMIIIRRAS